MIKVQQTIFDNKFGNCFAACLASIFEVKLEEVPWPDGIEGNFWPMYMDWLRKRNAAILSVKRCSWIPLTYCIGAVQSPRFEEESYHAVVVYDGKVVHDPHPSHDSESDSLDDVACIDLIYPIDIYKPIKIGALYNE